MPYLNHLNFAVVRAALRQAERLNNVALPRFDWGKSALDAEAITLLNETPGKVREALAHMDDALALVADPALRAQAEGLHGSDVLEIDDEGAGITPADGGTWVQAWVWVPDGEEQDEEAE